MDSTTLPKLRASHDMLVYFDKYIPYGGKHDTFKAIAKQIGELGDAGGEFLVAWVGMQDYGEMMSRRGVCERRHIVDRRSPNSTQAGGLRAKARC